MLTFGAIGLIFGGKELLRVRSMPAPIEVACTTDELAAVAAGTWVRVDSCEIAWDDAIELREDNRKFLAVPLLDATRPVDAAVAVLVVRSEGDEDVARLTTVEGIIGDTLSVADFQGVRWHGNVIPVNGKPTIDPDDVPNRDAGWFGIAAGVVLLGLGAVYGLRARRAVAAAQAVSPPIHAPTADGWPAAVGYTPVAPPYSASMPRRRRDPTVFDRGDDFNFVLLLGVVALILVGAAVGHYAVGAPARFDPWLLLIALPLGLACVFGLVHQRGEDIFAADVHHARTTGAFRLRHRGHDLDGDAEIVVFDVVASLIAITVSFRTRPLVLGVDRIGPTRIAAIAITILLGWWSLPSGPGRTIAALASGFRGGQRRRLADVLADPDALPPPRADA
jgi:hypothetical protein